MEHLEYKKLVVRRLPRIQRLAKQKRFSEIEFLTYAITCKGELWSFSRKIRCRECGYVLFDFDRVPIDISWYSRLRHRLFGECPNCGHKPHDASKYACRMRLEVKSSIPVIAK